MFSAQYRHNNSEEIMIPDVEGEQGFFDHQGAPRGDYLNDELGDEYREEPFGPLRLGQSVLGNMLDYVMSFANTGLDLACAAVSAAGSVRPVFGDETPFTVRILCFIGGFTMMMSGFMSIINIFTLITSPSNYIIQAYQCVFGVAAMFIEAQEWHAFANIKPWMHHWCRFLTVLGGRGAFYLFTGTLGLSVWARGVYSTAMGLYMATMGVICLTVATRNVMSSSKMQGAPGTELCYDEGMGDEYMARYPRRDDELPDDACVGYHDVSEGGHYDAFMTGDARHHQRHPSAEATTAASSSSFENPSSLGPSYRRGGLSAHPSPVVSLKEDEEDITAAAAASLNLRPLKPAPSFHKLSGQQSASRSPTIY